MLVGQNGAGKTNLLEAVHVCALGRSHRTSQDRDLIHHGDDKAEIIVHAKKRDGGHTVMVTLSGREKRVKEVRINGKPVSRLGDLMGHINVVLFSPEDLLLLKEGPSVRRRFLDMAISQTSQTYFFALQRYAQALKQRAALLKDMWQGHREQELDIWDEQLAKNGAVMIAARRRYVAALSNIAGERYQHISGIAGEDLRLRYQCCMANESDLSDSLLSAFHKSRAEDIQYKTTRVGPHHDELQFYLRGADMRQFSSQGQKRTAVLSLKLAQLALMRIEMGEAPVLLLDDVLSELDPSRRKLLLASMEDVQTIITCTDRADLPQTILAQVVTIQPGGVLSGITSNAPVSTVEDTDVDAWLGEGKNVSRET